MGVETSSAVRFTISNASDPALSSTVEPSIDPETPLWPMQRPPVSSRVAAAMADQIRAHGGGTKGALPDLNRLPGNPAPLEPVTPPAAPRVSDPAAGAANPNPTAAHGSNDMAPALAYIRLGWPCTAEPTCS